MLLSVKRKRYGDEGIDGHENEPLSLLKRGI
jgi:hypothetical protein